MSKRELVHRRAQLGDNLANSAESTASRQAYLHLANLLRQLVVVVVAAATEGQQLSNSNMKIVAHESGKAAACHRHTAPVCQPVQSLLFILLRLELYACPCRCLCPCPRLSLPYCFGTARLRLRLSLVLFLVLHNSRNFSGGTACSGADTLLPGPPKQTVA